MSTTAFPVLARILAERRMLKRPLGALALTCGAVDDAAGWFLIALATTIAVAGSVGGVARTVGEAIAFCAGHGVARRARCCAGSPMPSTSRGGSRPGGSR